MTIAEAQEKSTRTQHLRTFPTARVKAVAIPTRTFKRSMKCSITRTHSTVKPQMLSFFRCFPLYMILVDMFLYLLIVKVMRNKMSRSEAVVTNGLKTSTKCKQLLSFSSLLFSVVPMCWLNVTNRTKKQSRSFSKLGILLLINM